MSDELDGWILRHVNQAADMDGAYGSQCWDLFANYCMELLGAPNAWACHTAQSGPNAGYAGSIWEQFPVTDWQEQAFDRLGPDTPPRRGDVAFWGNDAWHPVTHVAIVIEDGVHDGRVHVLAQNVDASMVARDMWDTAPTDGYLRPKGGITDMVTQQDIDAIANAVWNFPQNGTLMRDRVQGTDQAANAAAQAAARIEGTANRNDWRLSRLMQSVKRFTGVKDDDTTTIPDLTHTMIDSRVYRMTQMLKRFLGIGEDDMTVPDTVGLTDAQLDAIADRVAARLKEGTATPSPSQDE